MTTGQFVEHRSRFGFAVIAAVVLAATWWLHLPLMLWDHSDLIPIYDTWQRRDASIGTLFQLHDGSHLHAAAYAVLLATTALSNGQPWLDCMVSAVLLIVQGMLLVRMAQETLPTLWDARWKGASVLLLIFSPGHLANLQWGWQVAVFIGTLFGVVVPVYLLTRARVGWLGNTAALCSLAAGVLGFTTALAVLPAAIALIVMRTELSVGRRILFLLPWLVLGGAFAALLAPDGGRTLAIGETLHYTLNYLGGGVLRFAEGIAAPWAFLAILAAVPVAVRATQWPSLRPWMALMIFGGAAGVLTALGRVSDFGVDHAFVTRYASFSTLFWVGWFGVMCTAFPQWGRLAGLGRGMLALTALFVLANSVHLTKKAIVTHERAVALALHIRNEYPNIPARVLTDAYGDRARFAPERLAIAKRYGFAPFQDERND